MAIENFLIFSRQRCGSTTLMHLLNCQPGFKCADEPLNPHRVDFPYSWRIEDVTSLNAALAELGKTYNGIKHVWEASGWPFPKGSSCNDHLLLCFSRVIFLHRKNILRRLLSEHVSDQTGVYRLMRRRDREWMEKAPLGPVNIARLEMQIRDEREQIQHGRAILENSGKHYLDLTYEELYPEGADIAAKLAVLKKIITFLGGNPSMARSALRQAVILFNPDISKINSAKTYMNIPGIEEIESRFGSDETGWVFK